MGPKLWLERSSDMEDIQWRKHPKTTEDQNDSNRFHIHTSSKSIRLRAKNQAKTETSLTHPNFSCMSFHFNISPDRLVTSIDTQPHGWSVLSNSTPGTTSSSSGCKHHHKKTWQWPFSKLLLKAKFWDHYPFKGGATPAKRIRNWLQSPYRLGGNPWNPKTSSCLFCHQSSILLSLSNGHAMSSTDITTDRAWALPCETLKTAKHTHEHKIKETRTNTKKSSKIR